MIGHNASLRDYCPTIDFDQLSADEQEAASLISRNLDQIESAAGDFRATLELFLHVHSLKRYGADPHKMVKWIGIAGRNGAIVAHSFWMGMQAINAIKAPTLWAKADMASRTEATKLFTTEFPSISKIRKSAAHPVELTATVAETDKHRLKEPAITGGSQFGAGTFVQGGMHVQDGNKLTYSGTFEGVLASYDLCEQKALILERVALLYFLTFYPLEHPTAAAQREQTLAWRARQQPN